MYTSAPKPPLSTNIQECFDSNPPSHYTLEFKDRILGIKDAYSNTQKVDKIEWNHSRIQPHPLYPTEGS